MSICLRAVSLAVGCVNLTASLNSSSCLSRSARLWPFRSAAFSSDDASRVPRSSGTSFSPRPVGARRSDLSVPIRVNPWPVFALARSASSSSPLTTDSRAERDRQLEELSEAVKLTQPTVGRRTTQRVERSVQMKGRISPLGLRRPDWRGVLMPLTPALAVSPPN